MRNGILKLAEEQMKAGGYDHLNFGAIASQLKTTRANLHYHFKNKETLALEVTKRFIADQEADVIKLAAQFNGDFPKFVEALEDMLWEHHLGNEATGSCVCAQLIRNPELPLPLMELAKNHFKSMEAMLVEMVISSQKQGFVEDQADPRNIAIQAMCLIMGIGQMSLVIQDDDETVNQLKGVLKNWIKRYRP